MLDGFYGSYYNLNQLVFDAFDAPVSIIGIFFGASYAVNATAYIAADFFSSRFGKRNTMLGLDANRGRSFHDSSVVRFKSAVFVWP